MLVVIVFAGLVLLTLVARLQLWPDDPDPRITGEPQAGTGDDSSLFVFVHGLDRGRHWPLMREVLAPHGATLRLDYPNAAFSNAEPLAVARGLADTIERHAGGADYERLVLIGQSMGALLVKRAFLDAERRQQAWPAKVRRVVLLAGMNRGWDISGQKPSDMRFGTWFQIWFGTWLARVAGFGKLILGTETGTPFVANLRLDWIKRMADPGRRGIEVVQLLGDIDDLVSAEDNQDLRVVDVGDNAVPAAADRGRFAWIKVRGTGHANVADFADRTRAGNVELGDYRRQKFALAATEPDFDLLERENEVLPYQPDPEVTHVVFVVHGIRDLGEWAAAFERELKARFDARRAPGSRDKLAIASVRYGYFGMGPFLLKPVREKYVKWLMDEYTETMARYPNAANVHFVGHSNGTYLLAAALQRYDSLELDRIVFGGSVVRHDYAWDRALARHAAGDDGPRVINYTAVDDWVVALFPRFFEPALMAPLHNDIGSAGFNGFTRPHPAVVNVDGLSGGHAAFLSRIPQVAAFLVDGVVDDGTGVTPPAERKWHQAVLATLSGWGWHWATWVVVWPLLVVVVVLVGWHVITAAAEPRWPLLVAYAGLLLMILRNV
jgi:alpha-beta hydrolase superfamily lysophospholipase